MQKLIISMIFIMLIGIICSLCFADTVSYFVLSNDSPEYQSCDGTYILNGDGGKILKYFIQGVQVDSGAYLAYIAELQPVKTLEERVAALEGKVDTLEKAP